MSKKAEIIETDPKTGVIEKKPEDSGYGGDNSQKEPCNRRDQGRPPGRRKY